MFSKLYVSKKGKIDRFQTDITITEEESNIWENEVAGLFFVMEQNRFKIKLY